MRKLARRAALAVLVYAAGAVTALAVARAALRDEDMKARIRDRL